MLGICQTHNSIAKVVRRRLVNHTHTTETAYYISSLDNDAPLLLACSRSHWAVENSLYWVLDVAFREDAAHYGQGDGAQYFALVRKLALHLLRQGTTVKVGVKAKRLRAALEPNLLLHFPNQ